MVGVRLTDCIISKHLRILLNSHSNNVGLVGLWHELNRCHIDRVATFYAVVIWLIIPVGNSTFEGFIIPLNFSFCGDYVDVGLSYIFDYCQGI